MEKENNYTAIETEPLTLSHHVKKWRAQAKLSIRDIATELSVRPQIVSAFEEGDYSVFPARVYALGYLKRMVDHFAIPAGDLCINALKKEWDEIRGEQASSMPALPKSRSQRLYINPRRLFSAIGGAALLFFAWVFAVQLMGFTGAPTLRIDEPHAGSVFDTPIVHVRGSTEKESQLTVNGREITMNGDGVFDEEIELPAGVNSLSFLVQNRFGKISQETRYVVVK
ncbi:MAG: helix-turn-helix domain-containing protein [bacterium]|nr:helix-turn-helix domain-containing protein [bacterium]MDZ4285322.1 helix-turn-helix domain-containing protein [Candidatus Sungbacteria bacterium]